jgi:hypothetical protein
VTFGEEVAIALETRFSHIYAILDFSAEKSTYPSLRKMATGTSSSIKRRKSGSIMMKMGYVAVRGLLAQSACDRGSTI